MDAAFPLTNKCKSTSASLVGSPPIFESMGVGNYERTPSMLVVAPVIMIFTLGGIYGGCFLWDNSSNLLKRYM